MVKLFSCIGGLPKDGVEGLRMNIHVLEGLVLQVYFSVYEHLKRFLHSEQILRESETPLNIKPNFMSKLSHVYVSK